jgi:hypothetical protein
MNRLRVAVLALLLGWAHSIEAGGQMDNLEAMLDRFKQRIDFDGAMRTEAPGRLVLVTWPDILSAPGIVQGGWSIVANTTKSIAGGAERKWVLRRGGEEVDVVAFVSPTEVEPARQFFLSEASNTMMPEVPYERGPRDLGTLSAASAPHPTRGSLLWLFRNVCTEAKRFDTQVDILAIARWLQARYEAALVASDSPLLRSLPHVAASPQRAMAGEPIEIKAQIDPASPPRYIMKLEFDIAAIRLKEQDGLRARLEGKAPGHTTVQAHLIDSATLISGITPVELDIDPKPDSK